MANPNDYISILVSLSVPRVPSVTAFGVPLIAAYHTHFSDRVRFYTSIAAMVADGFLATEPAVLAASKVFSAEQAPSRIAVGRRAAPPLQVLNLTLTSAVAGDVYAATFVDSAGISHALSMVSTGTPATDATSMRTAITAFTLAGCTVSGSGAVVTLTQTAGHLVDIQGWPQFMNIADATPDPGIATDLAAILAANALGWYGLLLDSNSKAEILAAAAWVEATGTGGKYFFSSTSDFAVAAGTSGNVQLSLKAASYRKTFNEYSGKQLLSFAGAAVAGYALGRGPGAYALSWKALPGITSDDDQSLTETQALTINSASTGSPGPGGQMGNYYRDVAGQPILWPGCSSSGAWVDQVIGVDALQVTVQANLFAYVTSLPKIPLDDYGIGNVADNVVSTVVSFATPPAGPNVIALIDGSRPITVVKPTAASLSPVDRQNRNLTGLSVSAFFSGAANTFGVQINVGP